MSFAAFAVIRFPEEEGNRKLDIWTDVHRLPDGAAHHSVDSSACAASTWDT